MNFHGRKVLGMSEENVRVLSVPEWHKRNLVTLNDLPTGPKAEIRLYDSNLFKLYY